MSGTALARLCQWYLSNCDGEWEHEYGVKIETLDNPGWYVEINLVGTELESAVLDRIFVEHSEHSWYSVEIESGRFLGACGPMNLETVIEIFLRLASY